MCDSDLSFSSDWLLPDVKFIGFDITEDEALGKDVTSPYGGWYFVIEERVSEVRFGLDLSDNQPSEIKQWDDLAWKHFVNLEEGDCLEGNEPDVSKLDSNEKVRALNADSPSFAYATMQKPVRITVHAKQMIPITEDSK